MHIPDGYLSPATAGLFYGVMLPFWYAAGRKVKQWMYSRFVPVMAMLSAFCFVIQMINVPLPGGTTGHAVGAGLAAIVLTPWPAVIAVSVTLIIQALFFGDGGITSIAANCFNMAVVQVFVTWFLFRFFSAHSNRAKILSAATASYIGVNAAALITALQLGIQPLIASGADGTPLYAPYPLSITLPAMMLTHLVAGLAEAVVTGAALAYLLRVNPELVQQRSFESTKTHAFWLLLAAVMLLTPLGLLAPGTAWGEWSAKQLREIGLGFVPAGLQRWDGFWKGIFADYTVPGLGEATGYILSSLVGVFLIVMLFWLIQRYFVQPGGNENRA